MKGKNIFSEKLFHAFKPPKASPRSSFKPPFTNHKWNVSSKIEQSVFTVRKKICLEKNTPGLIQNLHDGVPGWQRLKVQWNWKVSILPLSFNTVC